MEARTIAVQVSEQLFTRLKNVVAWKGCKQKEFLISVIEKAIEEAEAEMEKAAAGSYRTVSQMSGCRTDFADIQNKKECGGNRQWQNHYLRNWAANTKGKGII